MSPFKIILISIIIIISGCRDIYDIDNMESAERYHSEFVRQNLERKYSVNYIFKDKGQRALIYAVGEGDVGGIEKYFKTKGSVNFRGLNGETPLYWALIKNKYISFESLLKLGANPNLKISDTSVIHEAAQLQDLRYLKAVLEFGGDPNLRAGALGYTPIYSAINGRNGENINALKILLDHGADINVQTVIVKNTYSISGGDSPMVYAAMLARYDSVLEILKRRPRCDLANVRGETLRSIVLKFIKRNGNGNPQEKRMEEILIEADKSCL